MVSMMPPPPPPRSSKDLDTTPVTDDGEAAINLNININMSQHAFLMSQANLNNRRRSMQLQIQHTRQSSAAVGELPDYIKKAWGVTPTRLTDSLPSVMVLFYCVLDLRLTIGNGYMASMARARSGMRGDVWNTANIVPKPRSTKYGTLNYSVLAQTAVDPMLPTAFSDGCVPNMSLSAYATRFFELEPVQARLSPAVYIFVLIYLDRAFQRNSNMFLNSFNAHRMVLGAFVVAVKYHEDEYMSQHIFAHNGGVSLDEINHLEVEFLKAIDHRCFVSHTDFEKAQIDLMVECIEANPASQIIGALRQNDICGIDAAIEQAANTSHGEKFNKTEKNLLVRENTKALLRKMFAGMPIDGSTQNPSRKQWNMWKMLSDEMTAEQEYIYQMLLNIVIELDDAAPPLPFGTLGSRVYANGNVNGYGCGNGNSNSNTGYSNSHSGGFHNIKSSQHTNHIVHGHGGAISNSDGYRSTGQGYAQGHGYDGHGHRSTNMNSYGINNDGHRHFDSNFNTAGNGDGNTAGVNYAKPTPCTFNDVYRSMASNGNSNSNIATGTDGHGHGHSNMNGLGCGRFRQDNTPPASYGYNYTSQVRDTWPKVQLPPVKSVAKQTRSSNNGHIGGHLNNQMNTMNTTRATNLSQDDPWAKVDNYNYNRQYAGQWNSNTNGNGNSNQHRQYQVHHQHADRTHETVAVDHSTTIAKSAVSFILNDMDPFADLAVRNAYLNTQFEKHKKFKSNGTPYAAQQCSGQSLRMQW